MEFKEIGPKIAANSVSDFETKLGANIPSGYKQFLLDYNGGIPILRRFSTIDGKIESLVVRLSSFNSGDPNVVSDFSDLNCQNLIPNDLLSIGTDPIGNRLLLGIGENNSGGVFYWSSDEEDEGYYASYDFIKPVADSFEHFLEALH